MTGRPSEISDNANAKISPDILNIWYNAFNDMTSNEMIEVEYLGTLGSNDWKLIYANRNNFAGGKLCTLCEIVLMNTNHIMEHSKGKKHRANIELKVSKFRHPSINPEKILIINPFIAKNDPNDVKLKAINEELKNEMTNMNLIDMELIEYKFDNTEWNKLLSKNDVGYVCNMCKSYTLINLKIIRNHLQTAKHKNNLNLIQGLYHPRVSPIKDLLEKSVQITDDKPANMVVNLSNVNSMEKKAKDLIEKHAEINIDLLLQIEVQQKLDEKWEKLISKPNNTNQCTCTVCKINIVGISELRKHLRVDTHIENLKNMNGIYHPILAPYKTTAAVTTVPISGSVKTISPGQNTEEEQPIKTINAEVVTPIKDTAPTMKGNSEPEKNVEVSLKEKHEIVENNIPIPVAPIEPTIKPNIATSIKSTTTKSTISTAKPTIPLTNRNSDSVAPRKQTSEEKTMSDKDFRTIIPSLKDIDLRVIEFYKEDAWRKMILLVDRSYNCVLCNVKKISNLKCLIDHLKGKKHIFNMTTVSRFYHPTKTNPKTDKDIVTSITENTPVKEISVNRKEEHLSKTQNKNITANLNNDNINIQIINSEVITVEDSPEREIDKQVSVKNIDAINKTSTIDASNKVVLSTINMSSDKQNYDNNYINNQKDSANVLTDVVMLTKQPENIVLNPAAVIARNQNTPNEKTQYQQNKIITPRYKSAQKFISDVLTSSKPSKLSAKTPNFSTKSLTPSIDSKIEGLIGVEYVVKIIQPAADEMPRFECCLCEIELGGIAMQNHLRNLKHRLKYLDRHFQTCVKQYKDHRNDGIIMTEIVDRISKAIEKYHGRDLPYESVQSDYRRNRQDIMEKVFSFRHASELIGPSFTNIVDKNSLDDIVRNKHKLGDKIPEVDKRKTTFDKSNTNNSKRQRINSPKNTSSFFNKKSAPKEQYPYINIGQQNITQSELQPQFPHSYNPISQTYSVSYNPIQNQVNPSLDDEEHRRLSENFIKNTKIRETRSPLSRRRTPSRRHRSRSPQRRYGRSRSPSRRLGRDRRPPSRSPLREDDVWQAYRRKFDIDVKILDLDYEGYNKDPQSYPLYNEEWQNFWANRMNELKAERKDHQSYDFTSEWSTYFPRRLNDLYESDVEELKVRLRERFVLPMHNRELKDKRYFVRGTYEDNELEMEEPPLPPIINHNYYDYSNQRIGSRSRSRSVSRSRSRSNHKMEPGIEILNSDNDQTVQTRNNKTNTDDDDRIDFGPLTVVSVLRLLTALEDNLGSLGPRVVDLLSKALTLEKIKPNQSDEILLTVENCVFLETCSEKLKGQVLAGVIAKAKLRAVRQAIKDISAMVRKANEERIKKPVLKPAVLRKPQTIQKVVVTIPSAQKIQQTTTNVASLRGNTNNQISNNKQSVAQPQHPTVMSQVQKKDLASKLAAALAAQGKTDISTENCERLIEVYAMIDKKKNETENRTGERNKQSLSDTLTDILSSGNFSALSTLFQTNSQQSVAATVTSSRDNNLVHQLNPNQFFHQVCHNEANNNLVFNTLQNRYNNNFNQLANFDTSLNITSGNNINRQHLNNTQNQMNLNTGGGIWQNLMPQGNNQNWISGNNIAQQLLIRGNSNLNQLSLNQSNLMLENNHNKNSTNLLSQTLLNSSHLRNNTRTINNSSNPRIDTCAQNSPAYATGASYRGNTSKNNNDSVSYPNLWHRQNQQQSDSVSGNNRSGGNTENVSDRFSNRERLIIQQQNSLTSRFGNNSDERNFPGNNRANERNITIQNRRSDFTGRR